MDVEALRNELEQHLAKNPDEHAPHGFRDRFGILAEQHQAEGDDAAKAVIENELKQIRNEAECAWKCCEHPAGEDAPPKAETPSPRVEEVPPKAEDRPAPPSPEPIERQADAPVEAAQPGFMGRYGFALIIIVVVLAGAWYFFRR